MNIEQTIKVLRALAQEWHECCGDIHIPLNEAADTIERLCAGALKDANKYAKAKDKRIAACFDCGLSYGDDGWADFIVLDEVWLQISPTNSKDGLLCVTCMTRRMVKLGLRAFGRFSSGPFSPQPAPSVAA